jgi:hypothetical protein
MKTILAALAMLANGCAEGDGIAPDCADAMEIYYQAGCSLSLPPMESREESAQVRATRYCVRSRTEAGAACQSELDAWLICSATSERCDCDEPLFAFEICAAAQH